jgi:hypothetical protein
MVLTSPISMKREAWFPRPDRITSLLLSLWIESALDFAGVSHRLRLRHLTVTYHDHQTWSFIHSSLTFQQVNLRAAT